MISFKESQVLLPNLNGVYKIGAGVLALSFIDESTVMSAGYDTFIRVFDLRSNKWYVFSCSNFLINSFHDDIKVEFCFRKVFNPWKSPRT